MNLLRLSVLLILGTQVAWAAEKTMNIDRGLSRLEWEGTKVTGKHTGQVELKSGALVVDGDKLAGGQFEVDLNTISNFDVEDPKYKQKLVSHLKSDDFFHVEKFPTATFKITRVEPIANAKRGEPSVTLSGDLTVRGTTKSISFPAIVEMTRTDVALKGSAVVDRTEHGLKYGSGKFFKGLGDKLIHDTFTVKFDIKAKRI